MLSYSVFFPYRWAKNIGIYKVSDFRQIMIP